MVWFCTREVECLSMCWFYFRLLQQLNEVCVIIPCFTFREKKVPSLFGTRATWESTQCQSLQRHRGNSFNFLFDLNMIQIMSPVQSGSFSMPYSETIVLSSHCYHTQETLDNLILHLVLSHPASDGLSKVVQLPMNKYIDL